MVSYGGDNVRLCERLLFCSRMIIRIFPYDFNRSLFLNYAAGFLKPGSRASNLEGHREPHRRVRFLLMDRFRQLDSSLVLKYQPPSPRTHVSPVATSQSSSTLPSRKNATKAFPNTSDVPSWHVGGANIVPLPRLYTIAALLARHRPEHST